MSQKRRALVRMRAPACIALCLLLACCSRPAGADADAQARLARLRESYEARLDVVRAGHDAPLDGEGSAQSDCTCEVSVGITVLTPIECSERAEEAIADALCCPHIETMLPGVLNRSPEAAQCVAAALQRQPRRLRTATLEAIGTMFFDSHNPEGMAAVFVWAAVCPTLDAEFDCVGRLVAIVDAEDISARWVAMFTMRRLMDAKPAAQERVMQAMALRMTNQTYKPGTRWMALKSPIMLQIPTADLDLAHLVGGLNDHIGGFPSNMLAALEALEEHWPTTDTPALVEMFANGGLAYDKSLGWGAVGIIEATSRYLESRPAVGREVMELLQHKDAFVRAAALLTLGCEKVKPGNRTWWLQVTTDCSLKNVPWFTKHAVDPAAAVRHHAFYEASTLVKSAASKALSMLSNDTAGLNYDGLEEDCPNLRVEGSSDDSFFAQIWDAVRQDELDHDRETASQILHTLRTRAPIGHPDAMATLLHILLGPHQDDTGAMHESRWHALFSLRFVVPRGDPSAMAAAIQHQRSPNYVVRFFALKTLAYLASTPSLRDEETLVSAFVTAMQDSETGIRFDAVWHLASIVPRLSDATYATMMQTIQKLLIDDDPYTRWIAINAIRPLVRCGVDLPDQWHHLRHSPRIEVRNAVRLALWEREAACGARRTCPTTPQAQGPGGCTRPHFLGELASFSAPQLEALIQEFDPTEACAVPENRSRLAERGFVVVRNALTDEARDEAIRVYHAAHITQNMGGRLRKGGSDDIGQFRTPKTVRLLDQLLAEWHIPLNVTGFDTFLSIHPQNEVWVDLASRVGLRAWMLSLWVRTSDWACWNGWRSVSSWLPTGWASSCNQYHNAHNWHVDGNGFHGTRDHKFWVMLAKPHPEQSNLYVLHNHAFERLCHAADRLELHVDPPHQVVDDNFFTTLLNRIGCVIQLRPKDVLYFHEDVMHRTQSLATERIVSQYSAAAPTSTYYLPGRHNMFMKA